MISKLSWRKCVSQFGSIRNEYIWMKRSLKYLNYGFFLPQRYGDAAFSTFLARENWAFRFIRHWHGNEVILIQIASLLFIFAGSQLIFELRCYFFFPPEENRHNKQSKMSLASDANDKCRGDLPREWFWRPCLCLLWFPGTPGMEDSPIFLTLLP